MAKLKFHPPRRSVFSRAKTYTSMSRSRKDAATPEVGIFATPSKLPVQVTARHPRGTRTKPLPLLPSGPDGVHGCPLRGTRLSLLPATMTGNSKRCYCLHRKIRNKLNFTKKSKYRVAGLRPRSSPYSFVMPQKSKQKKSPELLACLWQVPSTPQLF